MRNQEFKPIDLGFLLFLSSSDVSTDETNFHVHTAAFQVASIALVKYRGKGQCTFRWVRKETMEPLRGREGGSSIAHGSVPTSSWKIATGREDGNIVTYAQDAKKGAVMDFAGKFAN